ESADAEDLAFEIAHADAGLREHGDRDGVAGRGNEPQVGTLFVGENGGREPHVHRLNFAGEQHLEPARAALHIDDLHLEALLLVKTAGLSHPNWKDSHNRRRDADLEWNGIGGLGGYA